MKIYFGLKSLIALFVALLGFTSCVDQYTIAGSSSVSCFDGRMLYLRVASDEMNLVDVDSCKVIHGRFDFFGNVDSVVLAQLFMENEKVMPVVLEEGNLTVEVDHSGQQVVGGPYNERLYKFLREKSKIEHKQWELDQKFLMMMKEGKSLDEIQQKLGRKSLQLSEKMEDLETKFIIENFDNPLGVGYFILLFGQYPYPVMTDQVKNIIKLAPADFLGNPFVSSYLRKAKDY